MKRGEREGERERGRDEGRGVERERQGDGSNGDWGGQSSNS